MPNATNATKVDNALEIAVLAKQERDEMRESYRADELQIVVNMRATCEKEKRVIETMYNHPHEEN